MNIEVIHSHQIFRRFANVAKCVKGLLPDRHRILATGCSQYGCEGDRQKAVGGLLGSSHWPHHHVTPINCPIRLCIKLSPHAPITRCVLVSVRGYLELYWTQISSNTVQDCEHKVTGCGFLKSSKVEMNGAVMTSGARCLCAQAPVAQASAGASVGGTTTSGFGVWGVSRLGHLKPLKRARRLRVQAAVAIDGKQVSNGPLRGSKEPPKATLMVDPLEAKRLAAVEWKLLQERVAFQKQQRIEAINGGWAVLGLTIGIILEGYTGKGILAQVAGYLDSLADFLASITPGTPVP